MHFIALCWAFFVEGWNDGSTGPLLPTIQNYYHVGFAVVSTIFILNAIGFIVGAFTLVPLMNKFGYGKNPAIDTHLTGAIVQTLAYALQAPPAPFPLLVISFGLAGYGLSLENALGNTYVGSIKSGTLVLLGLLHAAYGLGAFCAPLSATHFATQTHWSYHYFISLSLAVMNVVFLAAVFRFRDQDSILTEAGHADASDLANEGSGHYRALLGIRAVHFLTAFVTIYIGVEVTLGGWIVTYIVRQRQGGPSSGYISSGFFGGLTFGRVGLLWLSKRIGEARALTMYAILCIALEVTIWVVPSLIENALAVSIIGVFMGPMFPILVNHSSKILPRWLLSGALGLITGFGQTGSALLPFITGLLASRFGISSLPPLVVSMTSAMTFLWLLVPKSQRRSD
ncbi:MFS general substrate transporter [Vararia minispora EC-137]|uniref:MFS general substrate transporter n=1 Tax=Vararia minispora EC-137 TaxID=1314806 RepID=A0ACB8QMG3_9AGAM|nr:MFS general substrate transporter [Vararia minispora EC-137]